MENWIKDLLKMAPPIRKDPVSTSVSLSHQEASISLLSFCIRGLLLLLLSGFSCVQLCVMQWAGAYQVFPSMGFSRQEYWSGVPLPSLPSEGRQTENHNHRKQSNHMDYRKRKVKSLSGVRLFATPWTVAYQAPPSMGFSRQ